jgi:hypothetical protein
MANPTMTSSPPAVRPLVEILEDARWANCGHCWEIPGLPCAIHPVTGAVGHHVARFGRAYRRGLISGTDLVAALAVPHAFTNATVIFADGAR